MSDSAYELNKREIKDNTLYNKLEVYFLQLVDGKMVSTAINVAGMPTTDNTWVSLTADLIFRVFGNFCIKKLI